jgi:hypothetical protein
MITVKLLGGLGNQLFQFAYGAALTSRGYDVQFSRSSLVEGTHREYSLGFLGDDVPLGERSWPQVYENTMRYCAENLAPKDPSTLVGYWQSEKYFSDIKYTIRQRVRTALENMHFVSTPFSFISEEIYRSAGIGVHVRRQDYVNLQAFHGMPTLDYYREAISTIHARTNSARVFIFSDDPEWCKQNFPEHTIVEGTTKYEDLRLMSRCKHMVLANSSFSWWGAWLGDDSLGRTVIAPKQWFTDSNTDYSDIVPAERWVKL